MIPFYELSSEERQALTETAIREKRTLLERWKALDKPEAQHWSARAALAAEFLKDHACVADFGCGTMDLAHHLLPQQRYIPVDVVARDSRTLVCDLNTQLPPDTGATAAALLGVLEYLHEPLLVLKHLQRRYKLLVTSYCITDAPNPLSNRREHAWVNDFSEIEIKDLFIQAGWHVEDERLVDDIQKIWRLKASI
ncbi:hypothetical protein M2323_002404 [Rhodoblastus acidophilus]|uniref:hypothetical protein n=1 Tax=Rhodoblastus acidophilus TaxID=1074 RepID=UPI0022248DAD|nr:hypothetical protein [Rhodoblastus acidophilus]MCW2284517.1 hypothetical protein [Rhodoblastus acidophilus]MCW2333470.1 hypothetical protein [Rhodoblastus acidophilus]